MKFFLAVPFLAFSSLSRIVAWDPLGQAIEGIGINDNAGSSAAISEDGTRVIVGSPLALDGDGVARVYELSNDGYWSKVGSDIDGSLIIKNFGGANVRLGTSVDISGDGKRIVISAPGIAYSNTIGYVAVLSEKNGVWDEGSIFNSINNDNFFGSSVAMCNSGKFVMVGSPLSDASTGHAYLYQEDADESWSSKTLFGMTLNGMTGSAVSISGDCSRAVVNSRTFDSSDTNYWYAHTGVFDITSQPYVPYLSMIGEIVNKLQFNLDDDSFRTGSSNDLSNDGNRVIIGNTIQYIGGYAEVYDFDPSNSQWNKKGGELIGQDIFDEVGYRVGICGDGSRLIVGSPGYGFSNGCWNGRSQVLEYVSDNVGIGYWQSIVEFEGEMCNRGGSSVGISGDGKIVIAGYPELTPSDQTSFEVGRVRAFAEDFVFPSTPPSLSSCGPCYEHHTSKFLHKFIKGKAKYKNCKWLSKKSDEQIKQICIKLLSYNGYGPPRDVCPKTCSVCV
jgi:hypothetical protein